MDSISQESHSKDIVALAIKVLYLRNTSQIDELMRHSSIAIQQRWEFLGPTVDKSQPVQSTLFQQIDRALQWQTDETGEYIRNEHFMPELTEEQKELLCVENIAYEYTDHLNLHAYVPFAQQQEQTMVVDLVWDEDSVKWGYFNTKVIEATLDGMKAGGGILSMATTISGAREALVTLNNKADDGECSDDEYWSQFEKPEQPVFQEEGDKLAKDKEAAASGDDSDDYWDKYGDDSEDDEADQEKAEKDNTNVETAELPAIQKLQIVEDKDLVVRSIRLSLAAAALSAQAAGISEVEFLEMAHSSFTSNK
ncbi:hypothetical protein H4R99_000119 [Coemansia sp. RSA 1722]|nr:hypothetical protein LPJ57_000773 [Coemansia sp. RSA 486]KAJ2233636.1 hypothetical protein IWW45_004023 [Coemansia sp. RSA 485]KAJ2606946.1 hypothetical protein H4R99_000119 [Coemansia sp. RSA 1722]